VFELWDTREARLIGRFDSETAALDAAYQELRALAGASALERPHLAVSRAAGSAAVLPGGWRRLSGALRRAIATPRADVSAPVV
jgi:hypothetical protein